MWLMGMRGAMRVAREMVSSGEWVRMPCLRVVRIFVSLFIIFYVIIPNSG